MTTASRDAGAASSTTADWHVINWHQVNQNTRRLQVRIVQAMQAGRWGKVKALQRLLTHSFSGKALAVRRVTENQGKRTAGVDGVLWSTPTQKMMAVHALRQRRYRPRPLKRVYIPKSNGKRRPLGIPTIFDRAMQALYLLALEPIAETSGDRNSYGFRLHRSTADAIQQCYIILAKRRSPQWILEGDIKACFDKLSHSWLEAHIPMDKAILQKWLKAGYVEKSILYPTIEGTPQGGIISPTITNLALDGLETALSTRYPKRTSGYIAKVNMVRYADDFIITGESKALLEHEVLPLVEDFMRERGLELSREKTSITHIEDGFDFLGQNVRKYNGKLLIMPSKKNRQAFLAKVRSLVKTHKQVPAGALVKLLNPVIRGWALYHRHVVSKRVFQSIDHAIFQLLWRWAQRRHPRKGRRWVKARYFQTHEGRTWVFSGAVNGREHRLFRASDVPIKRHIKVRAEANPFDPTWDRYFAQRLQVKMASNLRNKGHLLELWGAQEGRCPVCEQPITEITGWHNHHVIPRTVGGSDTVDNRVLLHPTCHTQVHNQHMTGAKPRPPGGR
jgi:RNA-directed DNA polymerase